MQRIFAVELEGLIAQFAHTVTLGLIPADGVRLSDVLNDFELSETGRYRLPNMQSGSALEVVVQLRVPAQATGAKLRLLDLRLGYTPQEMKGAEVVKQALKLEFDAEEAVERLPVNHDVPKAVRFLMNARARREAMRHMDAGNYDFARQVVASSYIATQAACAPIENSADVQEEYRQLIELQSSLTDKSSARMNRKRLAFQEYFRRSSKKS
jgi:Ca-activated chloride channel family protein